MTPSLIRLRTLLDRLRADQRGNILILTGAALFLLTFAVGFGLDYSRAQRLQTKLDAAADAAALAAVDPSMLAQSDSVAQTAAQNMFDQQVAGLQGLTVTSRTVTISDASGGSLGTMRTVVVTFKATSANSFSGVLHVPTLPISGTSTASASQPPSMNFYIALDVSPSMLLPTTTTGIANLQAGAIWSGESLFYSGHTDGCDFACHATNMQDWNGGVYVIDASSRMIFQNDNTSATVPFYRVSCSSASPANTVYDNSGNKLGTLVGVYNSSTSSSTSLATYCNNSNSSTNNQYYNPTDNALVYLWYLPTGKTGSSNYVKVAVNYPDTWWLAQNYATVNPGQSQILLRTDAEGTAAAGVITYAYGIQQEYASANIPPIYKMQFFTWGATTPAALSTSPFGTMTGVSTLQSATFPNLGAQAPTLPQVAIGVCSTSIKSWGWTTSTGSTSNTCNKDTSFTTMLSSMQSTMPSSAGSGTQASPESVLILITDGANDDSTNGMTQLPSSVIAQCTAIKNAGTKIAILYTQYLPDTINYTGDTTFNNFATSNVPSIATQLQSCATQNTDGTYLMQTVSTDGDVSAALNTLFAMVVQTARLVK